MYAGRKRVWGRDTTLEEPLLRRLLVDSDLDVRVSRRRLARARLDALQPRVTLVGVLWIVLVVDAARAVAIMGVAAAQEVVGAALAVQKIRERTPGTRLDEHHALDGGACLAGEETEDGLGSTRVIGGHGSTAVATRPTARSLLRVRLSLRLPRRRPM